MIMTVNMVKSKEFDVKIKFITTNLERTPPLTKNYWVVKHRRASDGRILGSAAQEGWTIIPQLEHVSIKLTGSRKAAKSYSELLVRFTPVNKADILVIQVTEPVGFDFTWTELRSAGQWIADAAGPQIRLNLDATPGEDVVVQMEGVQLGTGGGLTLVKLTSYLHGVRKDERIDFQAFDLPGLITVSSARVRSELSAEPELYPIETIWAVQSGHHAIVVFVVVFSRLVVAGSTITISGHPYQFLLKGFQ